MKFDICNWYNCLGALDGYVCGLKWFKMSRIGKPLEQNERWNFVYELGMEVVLKKSTMLLSESKYSLGDVTTTPSFPLGSKFKKKTVFLNTKT